MKAGPPLVFAPSLAEARTIYGSILGLALIHEDPDQLVFQLEGQTLHVFSAAGRAADAQHGAHAASVITFEVDDLEGALQAIAARGAELLHAAPARNEAAGLRYAAFRGPGGLVHELVERLTAPGP